MIEKAPGILGEETSPGERAHDRRGVGAGVEDRVEALVGNPADGHQRLRLLARDLSQGFHPPRRAVRLRGALEDRPERHVVAGGIGKRGPGRGEVVRRNADRRVAGQQLPGDPGGQVVLAQVDAERRDPRDIDAVVDDDGGAEFPGPGIRALDGPEQLAVRQLLLAHLENADPRFEESRRDLGNFFASAGGARRDGVDRRELEVQEARTRPRTPPRSAP